MYDFETLASELLQNRPELTRAELLRRIEEKKKTVGAGYLTDQGALFLVAGELGVSLRKERASADMRIKDLYIGANDVTVVARALAIYPVATYKKKDGSTGKYRRLVLFDGRDLVRLTVWDELAEDVGKLGIAPDAPVRISNGYVKQGLDGKPNLNLGKRGKIEVVPSEQVQGKLVTLSSVTEKVGKMSQEKPLVALETVVNSEPRYSEFVRSDGSPGSLFQFGVVGDEGKEVRVVVWSPSERPELKKGEKVVMTNLKTKRSSNGEFEIHGDAGSSISMAKEVPKAKSELRVATIDAWSSGKVLLALDKKGRVLVVEIAGGIEPPLVGDVVAVTPDLELGGRLVCRTPASIAIMSPDSFPKLDSLATKLKDAKDERSQVMVEVIALSHGKVDQIALKDGTSVKKGELTIGDDTAEVKLVGWRELSGRVSGILPGERLRVVGATPKMTKVGSWELQISNLTAVEKLTGRP